MVRKTQQKKIGFLLSAKRFYVQQLGALLSQQSSNSSPSAPRVSGGRKTTYLSLKI